MTYEGDLIVSTRKLFLIAGVRKCGTTSIYDALSQVTDFQTPVVKESQFLALPASTVRENLDWYFGLYTEGGDQGGILLDGSTWCFASPSTPEILRDYFPNAYVVVLVRDPAKRAFSSHLHMHKQVPCADKRSFSDLLNELEAAAPNGPDGLAAAEETVLETAIANGLVDGGYRNRAFHRERFDAPFSTDLDDMLFEFKYFQESMYSRFLPRLQKAVGAERFQLVFFEEFVQRPDQVVSELLESFGLPKPTASVAEIHHNKTLMPRSPLARRIVRLRSQSPVLESLTVTLKRVEPLRRLAIAARKAVLLTPSPRQSQREYERARELLASEYAWWFENYPRTRDIW
jgi:hypothetical protein